MEIVILLRQMMTMFLNALYRQYHLLKALKRYLNRFQVKEPLLTIVLRLCDPKRQTKKQ